MCLLFISICVHLCASAVSFRCRDVFLISWYQCKSVSKICGEGRVLTTDYCFLCELSCLRGKNKKEGILFGTIGWSEIIIILIIALLLFGAKRLPEVGKSLGKAIREFKRAFSGLSEDLEEEEPPSNKPKKKE